MKIIPATNLSLQNSLGVKNLELLNRINDTAEKFRTEIYLVGGTVRDCLLNRHNNDIDLMVNGDAVEFASALHGSDKDTFKKIIVRKNTKRAILKTKESHIDIAPLAVWGEKIQDHFAKSKELYTNMKRRDFTVNALTIKIGKDQDGKLKLKLIDVLKGRDDLRENRLKCVSERSFMDDPIRILRGLRLKMQLGLKKEKQTDMLEKECLKKPTFKHDCYLFRAYRELYRIFTDSHNPIQLVKEIVENKYFKLLV